MTVHLTPTELGRETGLHRREVIRKCMELGVPIFQGRIDKALFQAAVDRGAQTFVITKTDRFEVKAASATLAEARWKNRDPDEFFVGTELIEVKAKEKSDVAQA